MAAESWGFYGRKQELERLRESLARDRWFFVQVTGRRRIGKTSLVNEVLRLEQRRKVLYIQIPDSDPAGVVSAARDFMESFRVPIDLPSDLRGLASGIGSLCADGWVVALDEFQYFHRKALFSFTSQLRAEVDRLSARASEVRGGLIVLGSIHTEMAALLEDREAPLFNRVTDVLDLGHLDVESLLELISTHADAEVGRLLFLWNLFEGVPKFYRDCFEQGVLASDRRELLETMFFNSSSPLRSEADNWFLRELRGRYDLLLKFIASHPGCSNADILDHVKSVEPDSAKQVGGYLKILDERYRMIERLQPVFAKATTRSGRFYIRDNFLRSWLAALKVPVASINFRPTRDLVEDAIAKLEVAEGHGLERLASTLYEERSRKGLGDFRLTQAVRGWWDRGDTEIDMVAVDDEDEILRLGTCKRSGAKLLTDTGRFDEHVDRFLRHAPRFGLYRVERVAIAPRLSPEQRSVLERRGFLAQDLQDLIEPLLR
ncbi:ATP-binding protein [Engelhardtia mirabilis]|uniref:Archaeal ATPase n=1 Tax=Engelhardtia mirabilis TaxID=2528011 RepID=A0A518BDK3_9BACT|nr:Archaeal ATPase [Planctomycetes bacterium Pla133]QDU99394.1 Archaeal ATPase [Planctomycetes bacterium Pla86]